MIQFSLFIFLIILFLYFLFKLVKDDYVFIRRNLSLEQIFDMVFVTLWGSLFFARVFYFIFHPVAADKLLFNFFSPGNGGLSLTGAFIGGAVSLFIYSRQKKAPVGRLFDFFTLAFLGVLPFGFLSFSFFHKPPEMYIFFLYSVLYTILSIFYIKYFYPKILSKTQKEGTSSLLFLIFFSLASLCASIINPLKGTITVLSVENVILVLLFIVSVGLLIKHERIKKIKR